ncbi:M28 family peptidase [Hymenobacter taeanensis]|uniref:M28 family peptidase n=1 Tax=Hymenobacter taeanensis TaxID=2735321 RepID=A0A6M6BKS4_9BACT|nr:MULTISPECIES: M28 family peptidase [Hymenobacter]QJX48458.1 M28 family peptidase [Hymenobacter taeanensis]UOQ82050.1 M28 family peptidase [Hymenobacter sp. 5414T-23]
MLFRLVSLLLFSLVAVAALGQSVTADTARLRQHLVALTTTPEPRNYLHEASLNQAADYISAQLVAAGARPSEQAYRVQGRTYRNLIGSFGPEDGPRLIIGAHYDVCGEQPGADDNGTGVTALLELARLLGQQPNLTYRIDLVAYTLEEPPFFRTKSMGSYVHAKQLLDEKVDVKGMVALEMLGYFDDRKGSQDYPVGPLKAVYGSRGNYVTVAQKFGNGHFGRQFARLYKREAGLPVKRFKAPAWLPGIDFSDHLNYWQFGYSAVLLTDTAFYRNKHYHEITDTLDRLDMRRLGLSVNALLAVVLSI